MFDLGNLLTLSTFGESHGAAYGGVITHFPAGITLDLEAVQQQLNRRRPGQSAIVTQRREPDTVEWLSGIFEGVSTGTPLGFIVRNENQKSGDYSHLAETFRPSHADYTYTKKYGFRDYRGGGRSSARETAMRVAAGAIAKKYLYQRLGVQVRGHVTQIGSEYSQVLDPSQIDWDFVNSNPFFCADADAVSRFEVLIDSLRREGTSCGARLEIIASGVPVGLGEPVFDRLDADIAHAMMSINAVKGVEVGDGMANHAGGILGGISSGQDIRVSIALKPTSSITTVGKSINTDGEAIEMLTKGRHDPCVGVRATPIAEAMLAIVLLDHYLRHRGQNADIKQPVQSIT